MSANLESRVAGIAAPLVATPQSQALALKSACHYVWNPFRKINFVGAMGIGRHFVGRDFNYYSEMERCQVYPLWNVKRYIPKQNDTLSGNALGAEALREEVEKAAGVCAADLLEDYGSTYGYRVLTPLIGIDAETAAEVVKLVQPFAWPLDDPRHSSSTLLYDLAENGPASVRIKSAKLDSDLAKKADGTRQVMLQGVRVAINYARENRAELEKQITQASMGRPGRSKASELDEHCCWLLGLPVPTHVSQGPDTEVRDAVLALARNAAPSGSLVEMEAQMRDKLNELDELLRKARHKVKIAPKAQEDEPIE